MKRALCIASMASNLDNFNRRNVDLLLELGYDVTLAANFHTEEDSSSQIKIESFIGEMEKNGIRTEQVNFSRKLSDADAQWRSIKQTRELLRQRYDLIHCHTPICSAIVRVLAKKSREDFGTSVIYTAHGFHFYDGAQKKNWLIYYPIEKELSRITDVLITINKEDYERAKKHFHAGRVEYVPGVGIDTKKIADAEVDRAAKRREIGVPENAVLLISVGELNENKNHSVVVSAIAQLRNENIHYAVVGRGPWKDRIASLAKAVGVADRVHLLGYRQDIEELYKTADICVFPSIREGLSVALMEAMASGLPIVASRIRGNVDLIEDDVNGYLVDSRDVGGFANGIRRVLRSDAKAMGERSRQVVKSFDQSIVNKRMREIYSCIK